MADPPTPEGGSPGDGRRAVQTLVAALLWLLVLFSFNLVVNPLGYFPGSVVPPMTWSSRLLKVARMHQVASPSALVVGSSRTMNIALGPLGQATGGQAFNASVDSARAEEVNALVETSLGSLGWRPRLLVIGFDPEMLHPTAAPDGRSFAVAELRDRMPGEMRLRLTGEVLSSALSWGTMRAGAGHLWRVRGGLPPPDTSIEPDGHLRYLRWEREREAGTFRLDPLAIAPSYLGRFEGLATIGPERATLFEQAVRRARAAGVQVVIFTTPLHDEVRAVLEAQRDYVRLHGAMVAWLQQLAARVGGVTVLDLDDVRRFGGNPAGFVDGAHIDQDNGLALSRALVAALPPGP